MNTLADPWRQQIKNYRKYIKLEKSLSENTIESYMRDLSQFHLFIVTNYDISPLQIESTHIEQFMANVFDRGVKKSSQARVLSGVKSFFNYLIITDQIDELPTQFVDAPKSSRPLPDVLSVEEIDAIIASIDLSQPQGHRNKAIIETLYSCGLRVSELTTLRISDLFFDDGFIRVIGKGDKQRLVPVSNAARTYIEMYLLQRCHMQIDGQSLDIVFLNRRGHQLTRVMIFTLLKKIAASARITKKISPHTLRHSFATHLMEGGASIRHVQQLLGHESISTTEIYTHLNSSQLHAAVETHHPLGTSFDLSPDDNQ